MMEEQKPITNFNLEEGESEGDESFVVLGASMVPSMVPDEKSLPNDVYIKHSTSTPSTIQNPSQHCTSGDVSTGMTISDLSPEEIQQKLDFLVEENVTLKETLYQNNMAMKKQFDTLVMWQEEVTKVHQSHKEKFAETKRYIEHLKAEKGQLENTIKESTIILEKQLEELQILRKYKVEYETLKAQNQVLNQSSIENMIKFELSAAQKKNSELELVVEDLRLTLKTAEENLRQQETNNGKLDAETAALRNANDNIQSQLTKQIAQNKLIKESLENEKDKGKTAKGCDRCDNLEHAQTELTSTKEQLMMAQIKITDLENKASKSDESTEKDETIKALKKVVENMSEQAENIGILQAQVEIYKADFEAERNARSALAEEKEQAVGDLNALQRRNLQLLEEVDRLKGANRAPNYNRDTQEYSSSTTTSSAGLAENSKPNIYKYQCPKCQFRFRNYESLENHVHRCLELDSIF